MATNLVIDPDRFQRALQVSGERTRNAAVTRALDKSIARREQSRTAGLPGKLDCVFPLGEHKVKKVAAEPVREIDFSGAKRGRVTPSQPGKTKISIRLDNAVIDHFRDAVEAAGTTSR